MTMLILAVVPMIVCAVVLPEPEATGAVTAPAPPPSCCAVTGRAGMLAPRAASPTVAGTGPQEAHWHAATAQPEGMVWIPGGVFLMGSVDPLSRPDEAPIHRVRVDGFWMDATEVTNAQFAGFVNATGYQTIAERPVDWEELKQQLPEGAPRPDERMLLPGSLVFTPPDHPVNLRLHAPWWTWTTGADWRHPEGPGSTIADRSAHPVVQIAYVDALAYCRWAGKRLPSEAEWEFAARGGLVGKLNTWGDEPVDATRCNTWQGRFPDKNTAMQGGDGFTRSAPVMSFPPNGYGLYDMAGNVWEWCSDLYRPDAYARQVLTAGGIDAVIENPTGPKVSLDPRNLNSPESRTQRGGSFLCNDSYCASYRPSARMACPPDTGMQHLGFRCVTTRQDWEARAQQAAATHDQSLDIETGTQH